VPIYPIALFSDDSARRVEPDTYRIAFPDLEVLQFRYRVIQLRHLRWHDFATRRNPVASALLPKMGMERSERPQVLLTSLRLLAQAGAGCGAAAADFGLYQYLSASQRPGAGAI
jgi:hypothetical protein